MNKKKKILYIVLGLLVIAVSAFLLEKAYQNYRFTQCQKDFKASCGDIMNPPKSWLDRKEREWLEKTGQSFDNY